MFIDENAFKGMTDEQLEDLILDKKEMVKQLLDYFTKETEGLEKDNKQYLELKGLTLFAVFGYYNGIANTLKALDINFYSDRAIENRKLMTNAREKLDELDNLIDTNKIDIQTNPIYEFDTKNNCIKRKEQLVNKKHPMGFF